MKEFLLQKGFISTTLAGTTSKEKGRRGEKRVRIDIAAEEVGREPDRSLIGQYQAEARAQDGQDNPQEDESSPFKTSTCQRIKTNPISTATLPKLAPYHLTIPQTPPAPAQSEVVVYPNSFSPSSSAPSRTSSHATTPLRWTDLSSGQLFEIDPRTGNSWRYDSSRDRQIRADEGAVDETDEGIEVEQNREKGRSEERQGIVDRRALKRKTRVSLAAAGASAGVHEKEVEKEMPEWLKTTLAVSPHFCSPITLLLQTSHADSPFVTEMAEPDLPGFETHFHR